MGALAATEGKTWAGENRGKQSRYGDKGSDREAADVVISILEGCSAELSSHCR